MKLVLETSSFYDRLTDPAERAALERELANLLGWVRIVAMEDGARQWQGGENSSTAGVEKLHSQPVRLTEAEVEGMVCPLNG